MNSLLKKLRVKFMLTTTGIVAILVMAVAAAYCISVYSGAKAEIDRSLDMAVNTSVNEPGQFHPFDDGFGPQGGNQNGAAPGSPDQGQGDAGSGDTDPSASGSADSQIDIFRGRSVLVYSAVIDFSGNVIRVDSPAIAIDEDVFESAVDAILSDPDFSTENGSTTRGKISQDNLFYEARVQNGYVYVALADSSSLDETMHSAVWGACAIAAITLLLTVAVSFFLARLFLRPVEEAWNKQRRFIADASHELKTPLTVIMANTEIVRSDPESKVADQKKWLDGTMDESERMQGLIADLLLLARIDDAKTPGESTQQEDVNLSEALENTLMGFEAIAFERGLTIDGHVEEGLLVKAAKSRIVRLPDILLDNACKYAQENGRIEVSLSQEDGSAMLRVFNSGPEIAEEDLEHLFDRFYRADESRSDDIPGYGLGLSIARGIAEESKGTITAENVPGEGVAFTVRLPLVQG